MATNVKKTSRLRRARKTRALISASALSRLTVHRTPRHIYAQLWTCDGATVLASASTVEKLIKSELPNTGNIAAAEQIGSEIAKRALALGITNVAFDRSGFKYHGRIKALADAARAAGLTI